MDFGLVLLGVVGLAIVVALLHVVGRLASERDSAEHHDGAARRSVKRVVPLTDDTITHLGHR